MRDDPQGGMKFSTDEMITLCERAKQGCERSHKWIYSQAHAILLAWTIRRRYKDLEWFYDFRVKLHTIVEKYDPNKATLGVYVIRCFRSYMSRRIRKIQRADINNLKLLNYGELTYEEEDVATTYAYDENPKLETLALKQAISELTDDECALIRQYHFKGMVLREISAELGVSIPLVSWRLINIRAKLKKEVTAIVAAATPQPTKFVK